MFSNEIMCKMQKNKGTVIMNYVTKPCKNGIINICLNIIIGPYFVFSRRKPVKM